MHPDAVIKLKEALAIDLVALVTSNDDVRNQLLDRQSRVRDRRETSWSTSKAGSTGIKSAIVRGNLIKGRPSVAARFL